MKDEKVKSMMSHDLVKKITQGCGWNYDTSGGGMPYKFKRGNFYLSFDCTDSHNLGTAKSVELSLLMYFDEIEYKTILDSSMPDDMVALKGLITYFTNLIHN